MAKNAKATIEDDDDEAPIVPKAASLKKEASVEPSTEPSVEPKPPAAKLDDAQLVSFSPYEDIDPAPVVGTYRFSDHGHPQILKRHKAVLIPAHVAEHLTDRKLGQVIG